MTGLLNNAADLGQDSQIGIINRLAPVTGLKVVDIGCGRGDLVRQLAELADDVIGVEPDPIQAARNREAGSGTRYSFVEAPAQVLPFDDNSMDGVFFSYSLHHIPAEQMANALVEAARVLKPGVGFLYVLEPLPTGTLDALYRPFHDEMEVRTLAYAALADAAAPRFGEAEEYVFEDSPRRYAGFDEFAARVTGATYNNIPLDRVDTPEVRAAFEAGKAEDGYVFRVFNRVNLYRAKR